MPRTSTPIEELSESIHKTLKNVDSMSTSQITRNAIELLVHDLIPSKHKISKTAVREVLNAFEKLPEIYLKPVKP